MKYSELNSDSKLVFKHLAEKSESTPEEVFNYLSKNETVLPNEIKKSESLDGMITSFVINDIEGKIKNIKTSFLALLPALEHFTIINTKHSDIDCSANRKLKTINIRESRPIFLNIALNSELQSIEIQDQEKKLLKVFCGTDHKQTFFPNREEGIHIIGQSPEEIIQFLMRCNWDDGFNIPLAIGQMKKSDRAILSCINYLIHGSYKYKPTKKKAFQRNAEANFLLKTAERSAKINSTIQLKLILILVISILLSWTTHFLKMPRMGKSIC